MPDVILQTVFWLSFSLMIYSYFIYPLILYVLPRPKEPHFDANADFTPPVSVVVAALNEEQDIRARIENLLAMDYPADRLEIMIASDGSTDRTVAIAREYAAQGVVVMDYPVRRGKVNVLNATVPLARHNIIVFSDANTLFRPETIRMLVRRFSSPAVGSVCGKLVFTAAKDSTSGELEGVYWRYETFMKTIEGRHGALLGANGALYAIRKELFYQCPPDTIIEDFVIPMKIIERGYLNVFEPAALGYEEAAKHIVHEKKRRIRIGAGDFQSIGLLWSMLDPRRGFPAFAFWSHKLLRWLTPFFMLAVFMANILLLAQPLFKVLFVAQGVFYGLAVTGQLLTWAGLPVKILSLFYYFVSMNLALSLGFVNFISCRHSVKWERTER